MKKRGTDGSLLASLPWTIVALALSLVPHVPYLPAWITAAFFACAALRWNIEKKRWRLPPAWLRIVLALAGFLGVYASYAAISGVGPGSALLAIMAALKLLETRQRRDQFVLLFICIFLVMASLLREQHIWSLPFLLAAMTLIMTAWLRMSDTPDHSVRDSFRTGARLILYAAPLMLAMWLFFPRIATPFWSVPIDTGSATTGLDSEMSPGDISALSLSDAVAFRVTFAETVPAAAERYWRGLVLHRFNGRKWSGSEAAINFRARDDIEVAGDPIAYEVTLEPTQQQWVFALDMPHDWSLEKTWMGAQQQLVRVTPIDQRVAYEAVSYTKYRSNVDMSRAALSWYLHLPDDGSNPRTMALARQMRNAADSDGSFIEGVLRMFRDEAYYYTLEPPALGSNSVDRFLFETRRGFCEHYASAFAVMMRAAGIPSRIVLGYQGGEMNPVGQYMIVRQSDAHAWTEVWLAGRGWVRVDPTGAVAPERIESGMSGARFGEAGASWGLTAPAVWLYELGLTWDALNAKWNGWILGYGPENQGRFMQWLGMDEPDWRKMLLSLLALLLAMIAALSLLLLHRYRPPKKDRAARLYKRFARKAGILPARGETPQAFARRVPTSAAAPAATPAEIVQLYLAARYGTGGPKAVDALEEAVARFRRS